MEALKHFEKIEAYVEGKMSTSEQQDFELALKSDSELQSEYDAYLATQKAMQILAMDEIKFESAEQSSASKTLLFKLPKRTWAIAASLVFLIGAGMFWYGNTFYNNAVIVQNYIQEPNFSSVRGEGSSELYKIASDSYYRGNYARVRELLEPLPPNVPGYLDFRILLGHNFIKSNHPKAAIDVFNSIATYGENTWKENAEWHRILGNIQAGNDLQAIHFLDEIIQNETHSYHVLAVKLKKELKSIWRGFVLE